MREVGVVLQTELVVRRSTKATKSAVGLGKGGERRTCHPSILTVDKAELLNLGSLSKAILRRTQPYFCFSSTDTQIRPIWISPDFQIRHQNDALIQKTRSSDAQASTIRPHY